ncbi:C-type lectin domain family 12 member B-like isoform X2 [Cheilinus undulatus]|uniref:C-type lectin domain family 12 member B-like isoform X2 n=1 Tax=Cheilinus undulatus TaxID=241271 RepID=UPI001BD65F81|nr:C-type lectin domain family 12 member B-like isoform X2 [Cheilinus undulatus]
MVSNDENYRGGSSATKVSVGSGFLSTVRVGSRSLPLYPRIILCLGLLDTVLIITAIVIGVYCGTATEKSAPDQTAQTLLIEFKTLQEMQTEVIQSHEEDKQALKEELKKNKELKLLVELNQSSCDRLQTQIESLHVERATLQSHISDIEGSCGRCLSGWQLINSTCYFHSVSETRAFKNWQDSMVDCISRGGNLTVINTWEKQVLECRVAQQPK